MESMCLSECGGRKDTLLLLDDPGAKSRVQFSVHVLFELLASFNVISFKPFLFWALMILHSWSSFSVFPPGFSLLIRKTPEVGPGLHSPPYLTCAPLGNLISSLGFKCQYHSWQSVPLSSISFVPVAEFLVWHLITQLKIIRIFQLPLDVATWQHSIGCKKKYLPLPSCAFRGKGIFPSPPFPMAKMCPSAKWQQELEQPSRRQTEKKRRR